MNELQRNIKITGTIKSNKREKPLELKTTESPRPAKMSYHDNIALLSWTPKQNKIVLLASMHINFEVDGSTSKPMAIEQCKERNENINCGTSTWWFWDANILDHTYADFNKNNTQHERISSFFC